YKFSLTVCEPCIVYHDADTNRRRIDIDKCKRCTLLRIGQCFANSSFFEAGQSDNVSGGCLFDLNLLQASISKNGGDGGAFGQPVAMKTDNRIANADAAADDPAKCDPAEIVAIVEIRNQHLEKRFG